jgi:hypothetical protein
VTGLVREAITGIREGFTHQRAAQLLAPLFKRTEDEVPRLLSRRNPVVKSGASRETAQGHREARTQLASLGDTPCSAEQVAALSLP